MARGPRDWHRIEASAINKTTPKSERTRGSPQHSVDAFLSDSDSPGETRFATTWEAPGLTLGNDGTRPWTTSPTSRKEGAT